MLYATTTTKEGFMGQNRNSTKNLIIGKNCVKEVLNYSPERIILVFTAQRGDDPLLRQLASKKIRVQHMCSKGLESMSNSSSHQGFVAQVHPRESACIEDVIHGSQDKDRSLVVMIDSIYDPQNFGAILRSCECFGATALIYSKNRGCAITPTVTKTSVGASEIVPIVEVSNLATTMQQMQKAGFWAVCTEISEHAKPLNTFEFPEKTLLILGSEGKGVQNLIIKKSDFHLYIPMKGRIDSLNVAQATAVVLHHYNFVKSQGVANLV